MHKVHSSKYLIMDAHICVTWLTSECKLHMASYNILFVFDCCHSH